MMNNKLAVFAIFALTIGLIGNAYAHKSEVVGDYKLEIGWTKEPPVKGKPNAIELTVTKASASDKAIASMEDQMDDEMSNSTVKSDVTKSPTTPNSIKSTMSHDVVTKKITTNGITGLKLDADISINGKKTMLKLVEDKK